jgi:hypothetical protein
VSGVVDWPIVEGTLRSVQLDVHSGQVEVDYEYEVDGASYTGAVFSFDPKRQAEQSVDSWLETYVAGEPVEIYVNSSRASLSALEPGEMPLVPLQTGAAWAGLGFFGLLLLLFPQALTRLFAVQASWPKVWSALDGHRSNLQVYGGPKDSLRWRGDGLFETPVGGKISGWSLFVTLGERMYADHPISENPRAAQCPSRKGVAWESFLSVKARRAQSLLKSSGHEFRPHLFVRTDLGKAYVYCGQGQYTAHETYPPQLVRTRRQDVHDGAGLRRDRLRSELAELELDSGVDPRELHRRREELQALAKEIAAQAAGAIGRLRFRFSLQDAVPPGLWKEWGRVDIEDRYADEVTQSMPSGPVVTIMAS